MRRFLVLFVVILVIAGFTSTAWAPTGIPIPRFRYSNTWIYPVNAGTSLAIGGTGGNANAWISSTGNASFAATVTVGALVGGGAADNLGDHTMTETLQADGNDIAEAGTPAGSAYIGTIVSDSVDGENVSVIAGSARSHIGDTGDPHSTGGGGTTYSAGVGLSLAATEFSANFSSIDHDSLENYASTQHFIEGSISHDNIADVDTSNHHIATVSGDISHDSISDVSTSDHHVKPIEGTNLTYVGNTLNVDASPTFTGVFTVSQGFPNIYLTDTTSNHDDWRIIADSDDLEFGQKVGDATWRTRLKIDGAGVGGGSSMLLYDTAGDMYWSVDSYGNMTPHIGNTSVPGVPIEGMMAYAGSPTSWDPGQGVGWYTYIDSSWIYMNSQDGSGSIFLFKNVEADTGLTLTADQVADWLYFDGGTGIATNGIDFDRVVISTVDSEIVAENLGNNGSTAGQVLATDGAGDTYWKTDATGGGGANSFETWDLENGTDPVASSATDTITIYDGDGILATGDATADSVTFSAVASTYITVNATGISAQLTTIEAALDLDSIPGTLGTDQAESTFMTEGDMTAYSATGYTAHASSQQAHDMELNDLNNVTATATNGDAVIYSTTAGAWVNSTLSAGHADEANADSVTVGVIEVATIAETNTGTSQILAVSPDALEDWTGSTNITSLGTVDAGTWNATALTDLYIDESTLEAADLQGAHADESNADSVTVGVIEVATITETNTGTSMILAVSPDALEDWDGNAAALAAFSATGLSAHIGSQQAHDMEFSDLNNVTISEVNGDAIIWSTTASDWINSTLPSGGASVLNDLTNVNATAVNGDSVIYSTTAAEWVNSTVTGGGGDFYADGTVAMTGTIQMDGNDFAEATTRAGFGYFGTVDSTNLMVSGNIYSTGDTQDFIEQTGTTTTISSFTDADNGARVEVDGDASPSFVLLVRDDAVDSYIAIVGGATPNFVPDATSGMTLGRSDRRWEYSYADTIVVTNVIELGADTDTTVARSGAGDLTIEGNAVYRAGGTDVPDGDVADTLTIDGSSTVDDGALPASATFNAVTGTTGTFESLVLPSLGITAGQMVSYNLTTDELYLTAGGSGDMVQADWDATTDGFIDQDAGGTDIDTSGVTNGQMLIGNTTGNDWVVGTIAGTATEIDVTPGAGTFQVGIVASPTLDATNITGGNVHATGGDTALGAMAEDIDMNTLYQLTSLAAPVGAGEAVRTTADITEIALIAVTDGGETTEHTHAAGGGNMNTSTYDIAADGDIDQTAGGTNIDSSGVTNGQMFIGNTSGNVFALGTITGTATETDVTVGASTLQIGIVASPTLDATNITGGNIHTSGSDTALGAMAQDINMNTSYQLTSLAAPVGASEAVRTTTNITEVNLIALTDGSDTVLHDHNIWGEKSVAIAGTYLLTNPDTHRLVKAKAAITITDIHCITDVGTVIIELMEESATGTGGVGVDGTTTITCDSNGAEDDGALSNGPIDAGDWISARIGTDASTPTILNITWYSDLQ